MRVNLADAAPCLLVASPHMLDPNFYQGLVLLVEYSPNGAVGLILNRPLKATLGSVQASGVTLDPIFHPEPIWYGGPVAPDHLLCLYQIGGALLGSDTRVGTTAALTSSEILLDHGRTEVPFPGPFRIIAGHAGWAPAQLDREIHDGTWLVIPLASALLFPHQTEKAWQHALQQLGIHPIHYHDTPAQQPN